MRTILRTMRVDNIHWIWSCQWQKGKCWWSFLRLWSFLIFIFPFTFARCNRWWQSLVFWLLLAFILHLFLGQYQHLEIIPNYLNTFLIHFHIRWMNVSAKNYTFTFPLIDSNKLQHLLLLSLSCQVTECVSGKIFFSLSFSSKCLKWRFEGMYPLVSSLIITFWTITTHQS